MEGSPMLVTSFTLPRCILRYHEKEDWRGSPALFQGGHGLLSFRAFSIYTYEFYKYFRMLNPVFARARKVGNALPDSLGVAP